MCYILLLYSLSPLLACYLQVTPVNDEIPVMVAGLKPVLMCAEGQEIIITAEYIYATDADSDNSSLVFLIARQPYHGVVLRNGAVVDRFLQADIRAGIISYKHTSEPLRVATPPGKSWDDTGK